MGSFGGLRDKCGVSGVYAFDKSVNAAAVNYMLLLPQQHRGDLSAGAVFYNNAGNGKLLRKVAGAGKVTDVFGMPSSDEQRKILAKYRSGRAIGHVRYATTGATKPLEDMTSEEKELLGDSLEMMAQPWLKEHDRMWKAFAFAWNGTLTNHCELREGLSGPEANYHFSTETDTEMIKVYLARELTRYEKPLEAREYAEVFSRLARQFDGAWTLVMIDGNGGMVMARDPLGFKPACYGRNGKYFAMASESCALDAVGIEAEFLPPGHLVFAKDEKVEGPLQFAESSRRALCIFEIIYFAFATSVIDGISVQEARRRLGAALADIEDLEIGNGFCVTPVPKTPIPMVNGYQQRMHERSGIFIPQIELFIPTTTASSRAFLNDLNRGGVHDTKLATSKGISQGLEVIVIDDSIIRGDTMRKRGRTVRDRANASKVHVRISCPPARHPCFYGINFPTHSELIAAGRDVEEVRESIGVESLKYQTVDGMVKAVVEGTGFSKNDFCTACFSGEYPTEGGQRRCDRTRDKR